MRNGEREGERLEEDGEELLLEALEGGLISEPGVRLHHPYLDECSAALTQVGPRQV